MSAGLLLFLGAWVLVSVLFAVVWAFAFWLSDRRVARQRAKEFHPLGERWL